MEVLFERVEVVYEVLEFFEFVLCYLVDNCIQIWEFGQILIDGGILDDIISEKLEVFNSCYEELSYLVESKQIFLEK